MVSVFNEFTMERVTNVLSEDGCLRAISKKIIFVSFKTLVVIATRSGTG